MISNLKRFVHEQPATTGQVLVLIAAALTLGGAWYSQIFGNLFPCPLCYEQRIPWYIASVVAGLALMIPLLAPHAAGWRMTALIPNAGLMFWGAYLGLYHVGVEHHWWGSSCTGLGDGGSTTIQDLMAQELVDNAVPCDAIQWEFFGITLAGMNFAICLSLGIVLVVLFFKSWHDRDA